MRPHGRCTAARRAHWRAGASAARTRDVEVDGVLTEPVVTPGHTADSVCFAARHGDQRLLLTGDTILGRGTTIVAWPDGDLGDYLDSLGRLAGFEGVPALPGHGPALTDTAVAARFYPAPPGAPAPGARGPGRGRRGARRGRRPGLRRRRPCPVARRRVVGARTTCLPEAGITATPLRVGRNVTCSVCGTVAVPGARFCHHCGSALPAAATLPAAERRIVTVLFGDLSDFTAWSEDLDPERVGAVTDRVLAALAGAVKTFGGHVDKLTGDGIMAVFGAPVAHEDDAERAVRAALSMQRAVRRVLDDERGGGAPLGLRIGINTGTVVAGVQAGIEYTVIGDTVNTAARLADAAAIGAIYAGSAPPPPPGGWPPGARCGRCASRANASRSRRSSCSASSTPPAPAPASATRRRSSAARRSWPASPAGSPRSPTGRRPASWSSPARPGWASPGWPARSSASPPVTSAAPDTRPAPGSPPAAAPGCCRCTVPRSASAAGWHPSPTWSAPRSACRRTPPT